MDNELIEKYKREMLEMYNRGPRAVPAQANPDFDNKGRLIVNVTTFRGLYPLPKALVTVFTGPYENMTVVDTSVTDESGRTKMFMLSAPDVGLSQNAGATEPVYTDYSLLVRADGYTDQLNLNLPIFRGITSLQSVDMTLLTSSADGSVIINDQRELYNL